MKNKKDFQPTIILNKSDADDFLDLYDPNDLKQAIKSLNKKSK